MYFSGVRVMGHDYQEPLNIMYMYVKTHWEYRIRCGLAGETCSGGREWLYHLDCLVL